MTEEGYRRLKRFAKDSNLEEGEGKGPATQRGLTSKERSKGRRSLAFYGHRLSSLFRTDNFQHRA
jgi:hypothetical protein